METAQHWDRLPKNQPAEIAMFQISEVQEAPAFNGRRSFWPYGHRRSLRPALRSPLQPLRSSLAAGLRYGSVTDFARST